MTPPELNTLSKERIEENRSVHPDLLNTFNNMHRQLENLKEELEPLVEEHKEKQEAKEEASREEGYAWTRKNAKELAIEHLEGQIEEMRGTRDSLH